MAFTANGIPLSYVTSFKYIGQKLQVINYKTVYLTHMALLFGSESWVQLDTIMRVVKSPLVGFLRHIAGKRVRRKSDGLW